MTSWSPDATTSKSPCTIERIDQRAAVVVSQFVAVWDALSAICLGTVLMVSPHDGTRDDLEAADVDQF